MATFLVVHGAWSAAWAWKKVRPLLRARGHEVFTPTHAGLGERVREASPHIDLETHITDMLAVIEMEDLRDFILLGHSYGGMVATGVADRVPERIRHLLYLDAYVPRDGQCLFDLMSSEAAAGRREIVRTVGEGWRVPPTPAPPDTSEADLAWINPRRLPQPAKTFEQKIRLTGAVEKLPRSYIYCKRTPPGDVFRPFAERARREPGWTLYEIDASHSPNVTAPEPLAALLDEIARRA